MAGSTTRKRAFEKLHAPRRAASPLAGCPTQETLPPRSLHAPGCGACAPAARRRDEKALQ
eukprot:550011-Prymnesium_polylepis.2